MKDINHVKGLPCVLDTNEVFWFFLKGEERITVLEHDGSFAEGGYFCDSLENGIDYLIEEGFIIED